MKSHPSSLTSVTLLDEVELQAAVTKTIPQAGLRLEAWHQSNDQFFHLSSEQQQHSALTFHLFYLLTPGSIHVLNQTKYRHYNATKSNQENALYSAHENTVSFEVFPKMPFRAILISIEENWLRKELTHTGHTSSNFLDLLAGHHAVTSTCSPNEYILANKLFEHIISDGKDKMFIVSRTLLLLSEFITRTLSILTFPRVEIPINYYEKMVQAENIIHSSIKNKLPSITDIALKTAMSESGLKRYFLKVFGKNIYGYYINEKMDVAKRMLVEKNLTVEEVSDLLGYEKPKQFIHCFKKHFSFLPGDIRKSKNISSLSH